MPWFNTLKMFNVGFSFDVVIRLFLHFLEFDSFPFITYSVLMECFLEHLDGVHFVLGVFGILVACTDAMGISQHGASVHTLPLNLNVLNRSGKSLKKQPMITSLRYLSFSSLLCYSHAKILFANCNYSLN